jgi:hypothetical protein
MKEYDQLKADDEKPIRLTIYKPEDQVFQKLNLCEYLRELYEPAEEENEHPAEKKKDFRRHALKECEVHLQILTPT